MTLLLVHAAATWFMVGLIWMVQVVHYPLFAVVGPAEFVEFERQHTRRMGALLLIPASIEVLTGAVLVWAKPDGVPMSLVLVAGALLAAIWVITALVQAPLHRRLGGGSDPALVRSLVSSNWWRTVLWAGRGALVIGMVALATSA